MKSQDIATMPLDQAIEQYSPQFSAALPDNIPLKRFKRVVLTALNLNPELLKCDRRSLFLACVRAAQDGLYPDGRESALVPYNKQVQYQTMVHGIRKRMENSGKVASAITEIVYKNDHFRVVRGDSPRIEHESPPLDEPRGDMIGAYAIIRLTNGEVIREVMSKSEIERIRDLYSRASRTDAPWKVHPGEMWRKTVLKRAGKQVPFSSEDERMHRMLGDDDRPTVEADYSQVPMPTSALPPRPGMDASENRFYREPGNPGQTPIEGNGEMHAKMRDDGTPPDEDGVVEDEPVEQDALDELIDAQTDEYPSEDELHTEVIPFDGTSSQAWYKEARARLEEMRKDGLAPEHFKEFATANEAALRILKGPGPNAFRSLWQGLDKAIKEGMRQ